MNVQSTNSPERRIFTRNQEGVEQEVLDCPVVLEGWFKNISFDKKHIIQFIIRCFCLFSGKFMFLYVSRLWDYFREQPGVTRFWIVGPTGQIIRKINVASDVDSEEITTDDEPYVDEGNTIWIDSDYAPDAGYGLEDMIRVSIIN